MNTFFLFLIKYILGKEVIEVLILVYASLIAAGEKSIESVPSSLREKVQKALDVLLKDN